MNPNLRRLVEIAQKPTRQIIGLMSGTSLDGLDVAWCTFSGSGFETKMELKKFVTLPFDEAFKKEIRQIFARQTVDFQQVTLLHAEIADRHAALVLQALKNWNVSPSDIDLLASHGQTVFHAPRILHGLVARPNATLQIGDGDHLAVKTDIVTLSDFRQKHVAAGGEGAPLALYGDRLLFSSATENRVLINIGGIANFTWLPADRRGVFATDTGAGNTLIDHFSQRFFQKSFDENGEIAARGSVNPRLLMALKSDPFFEKPFPKTTGPELFSSFFVEKAQAASETASISPTDLLATLTQFTAETLGEAILKTVKNASVSTAIYLSGGGAHNPILRKALAAQLPDFQLFSMEKLGISGDAKEAVLFAALANEAIAGSGELDFGLVGQPSVSMGKISFPS